MRKKGYHLLGMLVAGVALLGPGSASASATCDRVVAPGGSDSAAGTADAPFRTGQKLVDSLDQGQTGCFRAGTTVGSITVRKPVSLTSYPGERGTVLGRLWVTVDAPGTIVTDLNLNGSGSATSPTVSADHVTFRGNDVTDDHTAICFALGSGTYRPQGTVIDHNAIHDCGVLPSGNQNHGIYVDNAVDTQITDNWIYRNVDRGIQLYPNADHSTITGNVIDSNGEGVVFSGGQLNGTYQTADNNTVEHNLITNSQIRQNVESYYGTAAPGVGNVVTNNCIKGAPGSYAGQDGAGIMSSQVGFTASSNLVADPQYVNQAAGNYNLQAGSPCASILTGANVDPATSTSTPPPTTDPAPTPTASTHKKKPRKLRAKAKARAAKALKRRS